MSWNEKQIKNIRFTAVRSLFPDGQFEISAEGVVKFIDGNGDLTVTTGLVTEEQIVAEEQRILKEWNDTEYQRNRSTSYPSLQEQMDMQYWDSVNGTTIWKDAIAKVKTDIPKPSE
jgi:hypothetical protein